MPVELSKELHDKIVAEWLETFQPDGGPCSCMGRQSQNNLEFPELRVKAITNRVKAVAAFRTIFGCSVIDAARMTTTLPRIDEFGIRLSLDEAFQLLVSSGVEVEYLQPILDPGCPCEMRYFAIHDGAYYKITQYRTALGHNFTAAYYGPLIEQYVS